MPAVGHTGQAILDDIATLPPDPPMLITDLMYEESAWMLASDPGLGKSAIGLQIAMALSCGSKLFNAFQCTRAGPVYYLLLEGSYRRMITRLRSMSATLPYDADNLFIDVVEGMNLLKQDHADYLTDRIEEWKHPIAIIFDSMYMALPGGLGKDETAAVFAQASTRLLRHFRCCNIFLHHTTKEQYANGKPSGSDDRFYGSQFIKAHVNVSYMLTQEDKKNRCKPLMTLKKDNEDCVRRSIQLEYHPEDITCSLIDEPPLEGDGLARVIQFIQLCKKEGRTTTFREVCQVCCLSAPRVRQIQSIHLSTYVNFIKTLGAATLWVPK